MEVKVLQDIFIKILRSELTEMELDASVKAQLTPDVISALYLLSNRHDLAQVVSSSLHKSGLKSDGEAYSKFNRKAIMSVYRNEQMKYAYNQICDIFNRESIPYIPLKGSVIRPYYTEESMRMSCDIDILVKKENLKSATDALVKMGFKCEDIYYHDVSLFSPANIHLELHFNIQENIDKLDAVLKDAWQYAKRADGSEYEFTSEFFAFYMFAHISYHFLEGGCGMKSLMDIWVMEHKMGITYECAKELLDKAGIYKFAAEISKVAEICFSDKPKDEFSDIILSYILSGGVYGNLQNRISVKKSDNNGTVIYALKRLFIPYKMMTIIYPILKKLPILLPFCWVSRFFRLLFGGRSKLALEKIKTVNKVSDDKISEIVQMREHLGL